MIKYKKPAMRWHKHNGISCYIDRTQKGCCECVRNITIEEYEKYVSRKNIMEIEEGPARLIQDIRLVCETHDKACDLWRDYHESCVKRMIEEERDTLRRIIEECTGGNELIKSIVNLMGVEKTHNTDECVAKTIINLIRNAMLKRLEG